MSLALIPTQETEALRHQVAPIIEEAKVFVVNNPDTFQQAGYKLTVIKAMQKQADTLFDPVIDANKKALNEAKALKDSFTTPLKTAESWYKTKMLDYKDKENRILRQKQLEAQKQQDKLMADAEKKANGLIKKGKDAEAAAVIANAPIVAMPVSDVPKVSGISTRTVWSAEITDANLIPREYLIPDEVKLNQLARMTKGPSNIPGVKFVSKEVMAGQAGRY